MGESFRALCSDFYVNQKLTVKMDLPRSRETVLDLFERVRKQFPAMHGFRRYKDELALESSQADAPHRWMAMRSNSIRTGTVNPMSMEEAYALHTHVLEAAPAYLSISPLDVESMELLYGFDLLASGNHDAIVFDALIPGSPLSALMEIPGATPTDCQPVIGLTIRGSGGAKTDAEVYFEVKTRGPHGQPRDMDAPPEPISIYLILRKFGPFADVKDLPLALASLARHGEDLVENRLVPGLLVPIREAIATGNA